MILIMADSHLNTWFLSPRLNETPTGAHLMAKAQAGTARHPHLLSLCSCFAFSGCTDPALMPHQLHWRKTIKKKTKNWKLPSNPENTNSCIILKWSELLLFHSFLLCLCETMLKHIAPETLVIWLNSQGLWIINAKLNSGLIPESTGAGVITIIKGIPFNFSEKLYLVCAEWELISGEHSGRLRQQPSYNPAPLFPFAASQGSGVRQPNKRMNK